MSAVDSTPHRHLTYVGLLLYNVYNFTSVFLTPDILWIAVSLRILVVTPASLFLTWLVGHVSASVREWLVAVGIMNAFAIPAFIFWLTAAPLGSYVFAELSLILVYGNMLLLRFPQAIGFTICAFTLSSIFALTKTGIPDGLRAAFMLQALTANVWTLYANHRSESVRCRAYLEELSAIRKSEASEAASNRFHDLSLTDALTGLPNRRFLDQTTGAWSREAIPFIVMMIDVDHFKLFNDTLGHPAGDECLRMIASALCGATTGTDHFVARFGGEEFVVVARDLDTVGAVQLAKSLVKSVESLGIAHPGRTDAYGVVTISAGIAVREINVSRECAFKAADAALYEAKRKGRNRYIFFAG